MMNKSERALNAKLGAVIRDRRVQLGLTQQAVGGQVGISYQQIQKYERAQNEFSVARFVQVARVLEFDPCEILRSLDGYRPISEHGATLRLDLELARLFRQASPSLRAAVIQMLRAALGEETEAA